MQADFVGGNLPLEERREHEEALMRHYHDALVDAGAKNYSWTNAGSTTG